MTDAFCTNCGAYLRGGSRSACADHYLDHHRGEPLESVTFMAVWHIEQATGLDQVEA